MLPTSTLPMASLSLETIALVGFYILLGVYALYSAILYYHWNEYATDARITRLTLTLYALTTLPALIIMGIMTFSI